MTGTLAVVTPSFRGDLALFHDLHLSVLAHTPGDTVHHVVVPRQDLPLFRAYAGPRCVLHTPNDLLPRRFRQVPRWPGQLDVLRPWHPVRGWIVQQLVKLAVTELLDVDVALQVDSDVALVRPADASTFSEDGRPALYRLEGGVHEGMGQHVRWHAEARRLLDLPPAPVPLHDYIAAFVPWQPDAVRALLGQVRAVSGRDWTVALASCWHVSEHLLYGVFVDEVLDPGRQRFARTDRSRCLSWWEEQPLDAQRAQDLLARVSPDDVAVMVSAKSRTPQALRREVLDQLGRVGRDAPR